MKPTSTMAARAQQLITARSAVCAVSNRLQIVVSVLAAIYCERKTCGGLLDVYCPNFSHSGINQSIVRPPPPTRNACTLDHPQRGQWRQSYASFRMRPEE